MPDGLLPTAAPTAATALEDPQAVAEAFLATRYDGRWGGAYGTLPTGLDVAPILDRALASHR